MEDAFSLAVLHEAKELFEDDDAKKIKVTRMVKLVAFVADDVGFELTRGWYKYGCYSNNASIVVKEFSKGDLTSFNPPQERIGKSLEKLGDLLPSIKKSIKNLETFFIKDDASFYDWIYGTKAPEEFRGFYNAHQSFNREFRSFLSSLRSLENFPNSHNKELETLEATISNFYNYLNHLTDDEILSLFCDLMDLFEMVLLKIKNKDYYIDRECLTFLDGLIETYCGPKYDLCTLLVPYAETLTGWQANEEKKWYENNVELLKRVLPLIIVHLRNRAESLDLIPSIEELEAEIEENEEERKPLRELYAELEENI